MSERKNSADRDPDATSEDLPALVGRLGEDVATLIDTKLSLLKVELEEEVSAYLHGSLALGAGSIVAIAGFALVSVALALAVSVAFERMHLGPAVEYALGFLVAGLTYVLFGVLFVRRVTRRMGKRWP